MNNLKIDSMEMIPEEVFYNKELSDAIRDIVLTSPMCYDDAIKALKNSNNYERDVFIIKKLTNCGYPFDRICIIIGMLNN